MEARPRCDETAAWRALTAHRDTAAQGFDRILGQQFGLGPRDEHAAVNHLHLLDNGHRNALGLG